MQKKLSYFILSFHRHNWFKNPASWLAHEPGFSQIWDLYRNIANDKNFYHRLNSEKIQMNNFSITLKSGSVTHNFIQVSNTIPNLEKN